MSTESAIIAKLFGLPEDTPFALVALLVAQTVDDMHKCDAELTALDDAVGKPISHVANRPLQRGMAGAIQSIGIGLFTMQAALDTQKAEINALRAAFAIKPLMD